MNTLPNEMIYEVSLYLNTHNKLSLFSTNETWLRFAQKTMIFKTPRYLETIHGNRWRFESLIIKPDDDFNLYKDLNVTKAFDEREIDLHFLIKGFDPSMSLPWDLLPNLKSLEISLVKCPIEMLDDVILGNEVDILILPKKITNLTFKCVCSDDITNPCIIIKVSNDLRDLVDLNDEMVRDSEVNYVPIYIERLDQLIIQKNECWLKHGTLDFELHSPIDRLKSNGDIWNLGNTMTKELYVKGEVHITDENTFDHLRVLITDTITNHFYPSLQTYVFLESRARNDFSYYDSIIDRSKMPMLEYLRVFKDNFYPIVFRYKDNIVEIRS